MVERLKLVDARGLTHAELAVGKTATTLSFLDQNGHVRTVLGVTDTGLPALTMFDKDGATRMYLSVRDKTNMAAIQFVGPDKKVNFAVTAEETGDASLSLANGRQKGGIMLGFLENGEPRLWVTDTTGKIVTALP